MAYTALDVSKPTTAQTRQAAIDAERTNLQALRDMLAANGFVQGFDIVVDAGSGTPEQPQYLYYKRGAEWIRITYVWGSSGGAAGNVVSETYHYSSNSGGAWDAMADLAGKHIFTNSYDSAGNHTGGIWS